MKTICFLGKNGFVGAPVFEYLQTHFEIRDDNVCDVLVNCAGFSRMYEAKQNPAKMQEVENITFNRIKEVSFKHLIHLSTIYIEVLLDDNYSKFKREMEARILENYKNVTVLRLGSVLGRGLKKNVIFDLMHDKPLWVSPSAIYNYISTEEVAKIIAHLIENPVNDTIRIGSSESIAVSDIAHIMGKKPIYGDKVDTIYMDVSKLQSFYPVKTSKEYIEEFWCKYSKGEIK